MTIEELCELDVIALEEEFGLHIAEEIAQCTDQAALLQLSSLALKRLDELGGITFPHIPSDDEILEALDAFASEGTNAAL